MSLEKCLDNQILVMFLNNQEDKKLMKWFAEYLANVNYAINSNEKYFIERGENEQTV